MITIMITIMIMIMMIIKMTITWNFEFIVNKRWEIKYTRITILGLHYSGTSTKINKYYKTRN